MLACRAFNFKPKNKKYFFARGIFSARFCIPQKNPAAWPDFLLKTGLEPVRPFKASGF